MQEGMAYVMLGRCERLQDIYIRGEFNLDKIKVHPKALAETQRLTEVYQASLVQRSHLQHCLQISYCNAPTLYDLCEKYKSLSESLF